MSAADVAAPRAGAWREVRVPEACDAARLDAWLAGALPGLSRARLQTLMRAGRVTVDGAPARPSSRPRPGQTVVVDVPPTLPAAPLPEARPLDVVYEDPDIVVLDKPAGLVVHPAPGHAAGTLVNALLHHCRDLAGVGGVERPGIVHRLDKDTTGLLVVAKHDAALAGLARAFRSGGIRKEYLALVHGAPPRLSGTVCAPLGRDPRRRQRMAVVAVRGRAATTHYEVAERLGPFTLLRLRIETGRTHQIRVHLAHLGLPLVGDQVYGSARRDRTVPGGAGRPMLHACRLGFAHPRTGAPLDFRRPPHADMSALLARLRGGRPGPQASGRGGDGAPPSKKKEPSCPTSA